MLTLGGSFMKTPLDLRRFGMFLCATFIATFLMAASDNSIFAQSEVDGAFKGVVRDATTGTPIAGARVVFRNRYTNQESVTTSESDGTCSKTALPPAEYDVEITASGYTSFSKVQK